MSILNRTGYTLEEFQAHLDLACGGFDPANVTVVFDAMDEVRHDNSRLPTLKLSHIVAEGYQRATLTIIPQGLDVMAFSGRTASRRN